MQGLVSSFLFGLLTNRTLIVPGDPEKDESLLCEPFPDSSWTLQPEHEAIVVKGFETEYHELSMSQIRNKLQEGRL